MHPLFERPLDFGWVEATLAGWVELERGRVERVRLQQMTREIVAICRDNRERVKRADAYYDRYRDVLTHADRQALLRLMAETLLYVQYRGVRRKVTEDPLRILGG